MDKRWMLRGSGLGVVGLFALGCGGMGGVGDAGPGKLELKSDMRMAKSDLKKGGGKEPSSSAQSATHKKGEYTIKLREGAGVPKFLQGKVQTNDSKVNGAFSKLDMTEAAKVHGFTPKNSALAGHLGLERTIKIRTRKSLAQVKKLEKHPSVEWVEPVVEMKSAGKPNDPYYDYQWHMSMLNVEKAWQTTKGKGVVVAVIDTGVSTGSDGYFKTLQGYDFVDDDTTPEDGHGHGTHVAGTIGQKANNKIGVVGVAPEVTILPVRVLDNYGSGSNTWVANGIVWAADHGANVINMSLGGPMPSEVVADACAYAWEQGVTVIAATGNDGYTDSIGYPAAYPSTIAVGAVEPSKTIAFYSNQGQEIDLVAPGGDVTADRNGDGQGDGVVQETMEHGQWGYSFFMGTSMATPHVAGAAALLYANGITQPDDIRQALRDSADDLGGKGWDTTYGAGLLNPVKALNSGPPGTASAPRGGRGGRNGRKGGGDGGGGGGMEIVSARVRALGSDRAIVEWRTSRPAPTMLRGTDGTEVQDEQRVSLHRVTVDGAAGKSVTYTVGGKKNGETLTHTF